MGTWSSFTFGFEYFSTFEFHLLTSTCKVFERLWTRLLKEYDHVVGIQWDWRSLDSISVKAPLGGNDWT
jgi:hypothetical protein